MPRPIRDLLVPTGMNGLGLIQSSTILVARGYEHFGGE